MRFAFFFVFALLLVAAPQSASAQGAVDCPNTVRVANGCDDYVYQEPERGPGYGESISFGGGLTVLYAPSEGDDAAFRAAIAGFLGGTVDYFDAIAATPTVPELAAYDAVITWTNSAYADNVAFGDNLATYVDGGGIVKLGVFTTLTSGNFLSGAIMTSAYSPVIGGTNAFTSDTWSGDGALPVYTGVASLECGFRDILTPQGNGFDDSHYIDGEIVVASRTDGVAVNYVNGIGASQLSCGGDWAQLIANLIDFKVPVELTSFTAITSADDVHLQWETASETNNAGFEVQMQTGENWEALVFVDGHGTTTEVQTYAYSVRGLDPGIHMFRLKQIDFDGAFEYSPEVEASLETPGTHLLSSVYPNPFNPQASFTLSVARDQRVEIALYNVLGQRVSVLFDSALNADQIQTFTIDGAGLSSGLYVVRATGEVFTASQSVTLLK
ncbi:MAG: T9SS type A sorting domain-containing protein [Bacteroidetes bacterium]|nr:T9SS type A sorting domain-containing protein [Bacteroidota bacterium]